MKDWHLKCRLVALISVIESVWEHNGRKTPKKEPNFSEIYLAGGGE